MAYPNPVYEVSRALRDRGVVVHRLTEIIGRLQGFRRPRYGL
jgi:hypothetical protein